MRVSPSGYYRWRRRRPSARQAEDEGLGEQIAAVHGQSRGIYGAPRIVAELRQRGIRTSRRRCARLMRARGLCGRKHHRRRPRTTVRGDDRRTAPNRLAQNVTLRRADQVWVTDITYLRTGDGWLYVAVVLDLWSRRVVGWSCAASLHASLVMAALHDAITRRQPSRGLLHHSDRGSQYGEEGYLQLLERHGIERSMSRTGRCYDNATMESFWSTLKTEAELDVVIPPSHHEAELAVFDYIETFYNPTRRHSSLGFLSPVAFENQHT